MNKYEEALERIKQSGFSKNHVLVCMLFAERGIDPETIEPKENVLTFDAWRAKGRTVRKGQHGVKIPVWINKTEKNEDGTEERNTYPVSSSVFHISQTEPWDGQDYEPKNHGENGTSKASLISAKFRSVCGECKHQISKGDQIAWYRTNKAVRCMDCYQKESTASQGGEDYPCTDRGYEDECQRRTEY